MERFKNGTARTMGRTIRFDDPDPNTHDVVFTVDGQKFYCLKMALARHSPFFYNMFYDDAKSAGGGELIYNGSITAAQFDSFLKIINGVPQLNDNVVEGVLGIAIQWRCGVARQNCVHYLNTTSTMSYKKKFEIAQKFDLMDAKKKVVDECQNCDEIYSLVPKDLNDLDHATLALIQEKNLALQGLEGRYIPGMRTKRRSFVSNSSDEN